MNPVTSARRHALAAILSVALGYFCCARALGQDTSATGHPDTTSWKDLFAPDLSNAVMEPGAWAWEKGELVAKTHGTIWTKESYANFVLDLEFKVSRDANSGVFLRSGDTRKVLSALEIQVHESSDGGQYGMVGALYNCKPPSRRMEKPVGQWNRFTITCRDSRLSLVFNGEEVLKADLDDWKEARQNPDGTKNKFPVALKNFARQGPIGLQGLHGKASAPVWYRHLKIKALEREKIRLLITSGSHRYETNQFLQLFKDNPDVTFASVIHPHALVKLRPESAKNFDVLVMYDYAQKIAPEEQADLLNFLKSGKGLLILHHAIAAYPHWPAYERILGGRYYVQKTTIVNGVEKPRSRAREGARIPVHIADPKHPVTRGLNDFEIQDETYLGYDVAPDSHVLLTTSNTNNAPTLAWCRTCEAARVVYLQLGHDHLAYENPNFRRLVAQAIRWVARQD